MTRAREILIASLGLFAVAAQTLLFREFLAALAGNELAVGAFFSTWLAWAALGAIAGRAFGRRAFRTGRGLAFGATLYVPAVLLQHALIAAARPLWGVAAYETFPLGSLACFALVANAPTSFLTGALFVGACASTDDVVRLAPVRVYSFEAAGAAVGGAATTLALSCGAPAEAVLVGSAAVLCTAAAAVLVVARAEPRRLGRDLSVLGAIAVIVTALGLAAARPLGAARAVREWSRILPREGYSGSFTTSQAAYHVGARAGQFVIVSAGGISEALPPAEDAAETVAVLLSQHPGARSIVVVGDRALGTCLRLSELPSIESVTWLHPDPAYSSALWPHLPAACRASGERLRRPAEDPRAYLERCEALFDAVVVDVPDASTLVLSRYHSREFFELVRRRLAPAGIVAVRIGGAANVLTGESALLGASALVTLERSFDHVVLKPGDASWLIASDAAVVTSAPATLRDRFASVPGAASVYPPQAVLSLYPPDRVEFQLDRYRSVRDEVGDEILLTTDVHPRALSWNLLAAARRSGIAIAPEGIAVLLGGGTWLFAAALIALFGTRLGQVLLTARRNGAAATAGPSAFDVGVLVIVAGAASMATSVVLMFRFQIRFGSLFTHVGLLTSVFMTGAFAGGAAVRSGLARGRLTAAQALLVTAVAHLGVLASIVASPHGSGWVATAAALFAAGALAGAYFAVAARYHEASGRAAADSGASLELCDSLGAAVGAGLAGVILLPVLGTTATVALCALCVAGAIAALVASASVPAPLLDSGRFERVTGRVALALASAAVSALAVHHVYRAFDVDPAERAFEAATTHMLRGRAVERRTASLGARAIPYAAAVGADGTTIACVFSSAALGTSAMGYGGPIDIALCISPDGRLRDFAIIGSRETPAYVGRLGKWQESLSGIDALTYDAIVDLDAVSGATVTARAIAHTIRDSASRFASVALVAAPSPTAAAGRPSRDLGPAAFAALCLAVAWVRIRPSRSARRAVLMAAVAISGVALNMQYSIHHVLSLLDARLPPIGANTACVLGLGVPLLVLAVGNVYCGHLCPFGALQELLGELRPRRLAAAPSEFAWRIGGAVKYVVLALGVILASCGALDVAVAVDPLVGFFGGANSAAVRALAVGVLAAAVFYPRFWCRTLCPSGAFLALINRVALLRRWMPVTRPSYCDLGVRSHRQIDCISCDRCRLSDAEIPPAPRRAATRLFVAAIALAVVVIAAVGIAPSVAPSTAGSLVADGPAAPALEQRELRRVDIDRLKELIGRGTLSDREAEFCSSGAGGVTPTGEASPHRAEGGSP